MQVEISLSMWSIAWRSLQIVTPRITILLTLLIPGIEGGAVFHFLRMTILLDLLVLRRRLFWAAQFATWSSSIALASLLDAPVIKYVSSAYFAILLAGSTVQRSEAPTSYAVGPNPDP